MIIRILKILMLLAVLYVGVVVVFETGLRFLQPTWKGTLVLTTTTADGTRQSRVISGLRYQGALYIRANHWPREWYKQALAHPEVFVDQGQGAVPRIAVPVTGDEEAQVNKKHWILFKWRFLTGFPPLRLLRLDEAPI